jgi:hypothetical protein
MARLPNAAKAVVDQAKLSGYLLNPEHPIGRNKARVFRAALGLTREDAGLLKAALLAAVADEEAVLERSNAYGAHFSVEFVINRLGRIAMVRSLWTVRADEDFPRFVSAFVK